MPRDPKGTIRIFDGRKGGGSRRAGKVRTSRRAGKFHASFEPEADWHVNIDSRHLQAIVGTAIYGHLKRSIAADRDPETGEAHPKTLSTRNTGGLSKKALATYRESGGRKLGRNTTRDRNVDTRAMAEGLRRTITDYKWVSKRWGGKWGRIELPVSRMTFYFIGPKGNESKWNALNKADSSRRGKGRIVWLGLGGQTARLLKPEIDRWLGYALEGVQFQRDSKQRARKG